MINMKFVIFLLLIGCSSTQVNKKQRQPVKIYPMPYSISTTDCVRRIRYYDGFFEQCREDSCTECVDTTRLYEFYRDLEDTNLK